MRPAGKAGGRTASRLLASFPWVVVVLGVALLTTLLLVALLSFRGAERQALPPAPAPPILLPTPLSAATPAAPSRTDATPSPTRSATPARPTGTPSARPTSQTSASASPQPLVATEETGGPVEVTARYEVTDSDDDSFRAELLLDNRTDRSRDWRVELVFTSAVESIRVYSDSDISVWTDGRGRYVLRGDLRGGERDRLALRVRRDSGGDEPQVCTVNGADCTIG